MAYDFTHPGADTAEICVVGVGNGGVKAVRRIVEAQVAGARFVSVLPREETAEQGIGSDIYASIFPADMLLIVVILDEPTEIGTATTLAVQGRMRGVLTLVIAARPASVIQGRALPELESVLRGFEAVADSVILLNRERLIDPDRSGDVDPEEASFRLEQAFLMAVRNCVEPVTVPGLVGVDYADVRSIFTGGGLSFIGFGRGHGDCAAEDAVEMALENAGRRSSLLECKHYLVWIAGPDDLSTDTVIQAAMSFQKSIPSEAVARFSIIIDRALAKGSFLFNFIASGTMRKSGKERSLS